MLPFEVLLALLKPRGEEAEFLSSNSCSDTVLACMFSFLKGNPRGDRTLPRITYTEGADLLPGQSLPLFTRSIDSDCFTDLGSLSFTIKFGTSFTFGYEA